MRKIKNNQEQSLHINCRSHDGKDYPSQRLQLIMQRFFAQDP